MSLINQEFQKHIKKINNNDFIYKHKISFLFIIRATIQTI